MDNIDLMNKVDFFASFKTESLRKDESGITIDGTEKSLSYSL